jgi:hypothetical protein
LILYK